MGDQKEWLTDRRGKTDIFVRTNCFLDFVHRPEIWNHNVSEAGSASVLRWSSFRNGVILDFRTMDKVQKPISSQCYIRQNLLEFVWYVCVCKYSFRMRQNLLQWTKFVTIQFSSFKQEHPFIISEIDTNVASKLTAQFLFYWKSNSPLLKMLQNRLKLLPWQTDRPLCNLAVT
jgi:hypothetical protein